MRAATITILIIWTIAFLIGAATHALDIWRSGWLPYRFAPLPINIYWTALLPLDLLAAVLVWIWRRAGIMLAVAIMLSDVAINSMMALIMVDDWPIAPLAMQAGFMLFVIITAPWLWREAARPVQPA